MISGNNELEYNRIRRHDQRLKKIDVIVTELSLLQFCRREILPNQVLIRKNLTLRRRQVRQEGYDTDHTVLLIEKRILWLDE